MHEVDQTWTAGPNTPRVQICVTREPSDNPGVRISGTAWVDDVNLVPGDRGAPHTMKLFRVAICSLLAFAVLAFGAVEEWSQAVLGVGAALLFVLWAIRQYRQRVDHLFISPEFLPLCVFTLVVVAQLFRLTASTYDTRVDLQLLITYLIILFLIAQAYTRRSHWRGSFGS